MAVLKLRHDVLDGEAKEEVPTHLNTLSCGKFLKVSQEKLTVEYVGHMYGTHENDVGSIQANRPCPTACAVYYFEMTVINQGEKGLLSIGFTESGFKLGRHPGWEINSFGYHGQDGRIYHGSTEGDSYGPTFSVNDTVGAGINFASEIIFFTKNGNSVGAAFKEVRMENFSGGELYPTVGLHSAREKVAVNFGQRPFLFDVEALAREERNKLQREVERVSLPLSVTHSVVRDFLQFYGYKDTLDAFDEGSCGDSAPSTSLTQANGSSHQSAVSFAIDHRKALRQLIREGKADAAMLKISELYPQISKDRKSFVNFLLSCQKFIELVKEGTLVEAVEYAKSTLSQLQGTSNAQDSHLQNCLALLAYKDPTSSPVGYLLTSIQRDAVADTVNVAILALGAFSTTFQQSLLEALLKQLIACHNELRIVNGGQGEIFRLHGVLKGVRGGGW